MNEVTELWPGKKEERGTDMMHDFDKIYERRGTNQYKWMDLKERFGSDDVIPMPVADMDFACAKEIVDAIQKRVAHPIYGYKKLNHEFFDAVVYWQKKRHNWEIKPEWVMPGPGVLPILTMVLQRYTCDGDGVILQRPAYHPFPMIIHNNNRKIVENPLIEKEVDGQLVYDMDFELLEKSAARSDVQMMILCNPHNPVCRVWTEEELKKVGEICGKHGVFVISDEIHCDLIVGDIGYTPFCKVVPQSVCRSMSITSVSKTFNLPGLSTAYGIFPDQKMHDMVQAWADRNRMVGPSFVGSDALIAAYTESEYFVDEVCGYIRGNYEYLRDFFKKNMPGVRIVRMDGTYLLWMDIRSLGVDPHKCNEWMERTVGVPINAGEMFSQEHYGYIRVNLATQRGRVEEALNRILKAYRAL